MPNGFAPAPVTASQIAGALAGLVVLALVLTAGRRLFDRPLTWLLTLAERHPAWSQAIILLALFEAAGAMSTLSRIAELAKGAIGL